MSSAGTLSSTFRPFYLSSHHWTITLGKRRDQSPQKWSLCARVPENEIHKESCDAWVVSLVVDGLECRVRQGGKVWVRKRGVLDGPETGMLEK